MLNTHVHTNSCSGLHWFQSQCTVYLCLNLKLFQENSIKYHQDNNKTLCCDTRNSNSEYSHYPNMEGVFFVTLPKLRC